MRRSRISYRLWRYIIEKLRHSSTAVFSLSDQNLHFQTHNMIVSNSNFLSFISRRSERLHGGFAGASYLRSICFIKNCAAFSCAKQERNEFTEILSRILIFMPNTHCAILQYNRRMECLSVARYVLKNSRLCAIIS